MNPLMEAPQKTGRNVHIRHGNSIACAVAFALAASIAGSCSVVASNLLVNPSFESSSGHATYALGVQPATGWTYFSPPVPSTYYGDYWVDNAVPAHSGKFYWKEWGALYSTAVNNVSGIYQDFSAAPGSVFQANAWFYINGQDALGTGNRTWLQVEFYGASTNLLTVFKSDDFDATIGTDTWLQYFVTNACDVSSPVSVGDPTFTTYAVTGAVTQILAPPGTKTVRYRYCLLQAGSAGGSAYMDDAVLDQVSGPIPPVIGNLTPLNAIFVNPADGVHFTASSPAGFSIANTRISLALNGSNVSSGLVITGSSSNKTVSFTGLQSNTVYNASVTVTDSFGFTASQNTYFETTWVGIPPIVYLWEAEDFDFTNGMYFNHPTFCTNTGDANCYFGTVGVEGVDEHATGTATTHLYRPADAIGTAVAGDYSRKDHVDAGVLDYRIDPFVNGSWLDYTRDWSNGTFWVIARLSTDIGLSGAVTLSQVNADQSTTDIGTFSIANGRGWSTFENVYLKDTNGNIAAVTLKGTSTLRMTSGGNLLPNFLALVAGQIDLPQISNLYPDGAHPFENTNTFSFSVTSSGATIPVSGISLNLDGVDVSSSLTISGSASTKSVVYPSLKPDALHLAILTITNSLGHGILLTNSFDTFSQSNYMVEAEDFDYGGGQFVTNWFPNAYDTLGAMTNIDFQHTPVSGQAFTYRSDGIPEGRSSDYLRQAFIDVLGTDYDLTWFVNGDWANYTRVYPPGSYYVYGRFSGLGDYSMELDQIVSGAGTSNQTVHPLGRWHAVGRGYNLYDWVQLMNTTQTGPAVVSLNGQATLRIATSGNTNPNFFMLVPINGIPLSIQHNGTGVVLSFPTQSGNSYRVLYTNNLGSTNWNLLTTVAGDGTQKSVTDNSTDTARFYKVVSP